MPLARRAPPGGGPGQPDPERAAGVPRGDAARTTAEGEQQPHGGRSGIPDQESQQVGRGRLLPEHDQGDTEHGPAERTGQGQHHERPRQVEDPQVGLHVDNREARSGRHRQGQGLGVVNARPRGRPGCRGCPTAQSRAEAPPRRTRLRAPATPTLEDPVPGDGARAPSPATIMPTWMMTSPVATMPYSEAPRTLVTNGVTTALLRTGRRCPRCRAARPSTARLRSRRWGGLRHPRTRGRGR